MKLGAIAAGLALALAHHVAGQPLPLGGDAVPKCEKISVRREVRTLSNDEWNTYTSAVQRAVDDGWINWFGFFHQKIERVIHGNAQFFLAHRSLMADYEAILRGYEPSVVLPYWSSGMDFNKPTASRVLSDGFLGGNGDAANGGCVTGGLGRDWKFSYPNDHCLTRRYGEARAINAWYPPEFITSVLQTSKTYTELRLGLENSIHGIVHLSLGGDMNTMHSPTDSVFWLHHANIDRLHSQWQAADPDNRNFMYDGTNRDGSPALLSDSIAYTTTPAVELMRLGYGKLCYTYDTIEEANGNAAALLSKKLDTRGNAPAGKCIPGPQKAVSAEIQTLQGLPKAHLEKYFPGLTGDANLMENDMRSLNALRPADIGRDADFEVVTPDETMRGKMSYPMTLTDEFITMMHLDRKAVRDLEA
ncbi:hypothetical protein H4R19_004771, partial [Coemansia spiralis]